jgi:hypothetical protein
MSRAAKLATAISIIGFRSTRAVEFLESISRQALTRIDRAHREASPRSDTGSDTWPSVPSCSRPAAQPRIIRDALAAPASNMLAKTAIAATHNAPKK